MDKKIKKVLIANRGEIALRIIRACKEIGKETVAVHSLADDNTLHRTFSDEDVCIGRPAAADSYLNIPRIIAAAEITGADAIHPGYGFLSENAHFAEICEEHGINFIGPSSNIIKSMGDKSAARETMAKAKVPIVPGTGILKNEEEAIKKAKEIKYPVILKATAGGGGKGMRICENEEELKQNFTLARNEAQAAFGNPGVYMEKFIRNPHHVEVQILADKHGNVIHLGERDCSVQRNHQKLIEETPSPFINEKTRKEIREAAVRGATEAKYFSAGTIEFLVDEDGSFYFMEMNTRIQVEHTISELYTGIDILKWQIKIAEGEKIPFKQEDIIFRGHVIECRINAEDPFSNFAPDPGKITAYHVPQGLGIRVDSHCFVDYEIPPHYDSLIGKLIVMGLDRKEAISKTITALDEFIIEGVATTLPFHRQVMDDKTFNKGIHNTGFLETFELKKDE